MARRYVSRQCDVCFPEDALTVSRQHAKLVITPGKVTLADLGSRAGTSVNDHRVGLRELADGDKITMGDQTFRVVIPPPPENYLTRYDVSGTPIPESSDSPDLQPGALTPSPPMVRFENAPEMSRKSRPEGCGHAQTLPPLQPTPLPRKMLREIDLQLLTRMLKATLDWRKLWVAFAPGVVAAGAGGAAVLAARASVRLRGQVDTVDMILILLALLLFWTGCLGVSAGGVAHMVFAELEETGAAGWRKGYAFMRKRFMELAFVSMGIVIALILVAFPFDVGAMLIANRTTAGGVFGSMLLVPVSILHLALLAIAPTAWLVPCIMAVEDCDAAQGATRCLRLLQKRTPALIFALAFTLATIIPVVLLPVPLSVGALATTACVALPWNGAATAGLANVTASLLSSKPLLVVIAVCTAGGALVTVVAVTAAMTVAYTVTSRTGQSS